MVKGQGNSMRVCSGAWEKMSYFFAYMRAAACGCQLIYWTCCCEEELRARVRYEIIRDTFWPKTGSVNCKDNSGLNARLPHYPIFKLAASGKQFVCP